MQRLHGILLILFLSLLHIPLFGQSNPHNTLHDALALENEGSFETAAQMAKVAIDSGKLAGVELGRAYIVLGVACQGAGKLTEAQIAFEHSLRILKQDSQHIEDYAAALENYAGFFSDLEQYEMAGPIWRKSLHLRQQLGDHTGAMLCLTHLAGLALAQKKTHRAREFLEKASEEMAVAHDLLDGDVALFFETKGWLTLSEGHVSAAVTSYARALELCSRTHGEKHWLTGWEFVLLGKALTQAGDLNRGLDDMRKGLGILDQAVGRNNPRFFMADLAYSRVLDRLGLQAEATQQRMAAEQARTEYYSHQCMGCTIPVSALQ